LIPVYDNFYHHNRNYGCRYQEIVYKGYHTLLPENEILRMTILDRGTDIIELLYKAKEVDYMWRSPLDVDASNKSPVTRSEPSVYCFRQPYRRIEGIGAP
jgi:hypothetical protein